MAATARYAGNNLNISSGLAHDLEYLQRDAHTALNEQVAEVKRMLCRFMQSLSSTG